MTLIALFASLFELSGSAVPVSRPAVREATACRELLRQHHLAGWRSNFGM